MVSTVIELPATAELTIWSAVVSGVRLVSPLLVTSSAAVVAGMFGAISIDNVTVLETVYGSVSGPKEFFCMTLISDPEICCCGKSSAVTVFTQLDSRFEPIGADKTNVSFSLPSMWFFSNRLQTILNFNASGIYLCVVISHHVVHDKTDSVRPSGAKTTYRSRQESRYLRGMK